MAFAGHGRQSSGRRPSTAVESGYRVPVMATEKEILRIDGHEVDRSRTRARSTSLRRGHTKLDLVQYYLAVADGALRGAGGRPMALKRFVDGAAGRGVLPEAGAGQPARLDPDRELTFPRAGPPTRSSSTSAAGLAWVANLGCIDLNPHPVRAEDLDHPDELRVDLDPVPGVAVVADPRRRARLRARRSRRSGSSAGPRRRARAGSTSTSGSSRAGRIPEVRRAALALARDVERRAPDLATSKWWKEERHGVFLDYNQNAKDRTVASAYSVRPLPDARVSTPLRWDEVPTVEAEAFTIETVPARFAAIGDPGAGIDDAVGSLEALLELSRRHEAEGEGDAPWPPNYAKQAGEPPRVQPSQARRPPTEYEPGRGEAGGPPPEVAAERAAAVAAGDPNAGPADRVGRLAADPDRPAQDVDPGHRDRPGGHEGRGARGPRALEGAPSGVAALPRAGRRPGRRDARPLVALVPRPGEPHPRAGGGPAGAGAARPRLRPVGRVRIEAVEGRAGRLAAPAARRRSRSRRSRATGERDIPSRPSRQGLDRLA